MRLISLTIAGYRQFLEKVELEVPTGLTGICGPNGVGKSKLIESIGYALFGPHRSLLPTSDKEDDLASTGGAAKVFPEVTLVVESHGERYRIVRARKTKGKDCRIERVSSASPDGDTAGGHVSVVLARSPGEVTKKVVELFGITPESYLRTFVARQKEVAGIQAVAGEKRRKLINRLIGVAQIEKALALAEAERKRRKQNLDDRVASEGDAADVEKATSVLDTRFEEARAASGREEQTVRDLDAARRATTDARQRCESLQRDTAAVAAKQTELDGLVAAAPDLERNLRDARENAEKARTAERLLDEAEAVLRDTADADAEVQRHETVLAMHNLRQDAATAASVLGGLKTRHDEREALLARLRESRKRAELAQAEVGRLRAEAGTAEQTHTEAVAAAERAEERLRTVTEIGPTGTCERCGQPLGNNLETALAHLRAERDSAVAAAERAGIRAKEAGEAADLAVTQHAQIVKGRDVLQAEYDEGAELPGQLSEAEQAFTELTDTLDTYPAELSGALYDPEAHEKACDAVARRQVAEGVRQANAAMAVQVGSAAETVARMERQWVQSVTRCLALRTELEGLADAQAAVGQAEGLLEKAQQAEQEAEAAWKAASIERAQADAQVTIARSGVTQAEERAAALQRLRRELEVAERTESLLSATRNEITGEVCPRLSEMMDGWARALMGPHFKMVRLTDDYRIEADNGSGVHTIEHFSGGEQTLLAVMLRVAISRYSQERAGVESGFLILDEVFGDQDDLHRGQLVQFLNEIKPHYSQILIVNHVADVTEMLNTIIDVEPVGDRTSRARLRKQ